MDATGLGQFALLFCASTAAAAAALWLSHLFSNAWPGRRPAVVWGVFDAPRAYEFRDGYLISDVARDDVLLGDTVDRALAWDALTDALAGLAPDVRRAMRRLSQTGESFMTVGRIGEDPLSISGHTRDGSVEVVVASMQERGEKEVVDADSLGRLRQDAEQMRAALDQGRVVYWREDDAGTVTWANAAYLRLMEWADGVGSHGGWPLPRLFGDQTRPPPEAGSVRRCLISADDQTNPACFEVGAAREDAGWLFTALPADRLIAAEESLRNFVQTLSKTFAHLPIGLAIFDKRRDLVLFNPALVTLSGLDPEWLSSRPSLFSFLDQLRENRHMPEPKDYKAWRSSIAEFEKAAQDGSYHELWTLPTGQTYRVIGRPHPDGAVAFMFEDISSEVSLTRQFRAELELYQSVVDDSDRAIAVFSSERQLVLSNAAYSELWHHDPRELLGALGLAEALRRWEATAGPSHLWGAIRSFAESRGDRAGWADRVRLTDGTELDCRVTALRGAATLVTFSRVLDRAEERRRDSGERGETCAPEGADLTG